MLPRNLLDLRLRMINEDILSPIQASIVQDNLFFSKCINLNKVQFCKDQGNSPNRLLLLKSNAMSCIKAGFGYKLFPARLRFPLLRFSLSFFSFFFFSTARISTLGDKALFYTVHTLFIHYSCTVHGTHNQFIQKKNIYIYIYIKNGSYGTIHTFKNYFATMFSIFSF